jgi:small subunit ribosomal protein S2
MFVVDSKKEHIAVDEARKLGIPVVAIVDTNADPDLITVPIAGNDDAIRSVELITKTIADTIGEARREAPARQDDEETEYSTYSSERGSERADRGPRPGGGGGDDRSRRPRRRRARPEAIAALRGEGAPAAEGGDAPASEGGAAPSEAAPAE